MLGWERVSVKNYAALQKICQEAWNIIGTTFEGSVPDDNEGAVPTNGTTVPPFTEGLLRSILPLTSEQQTELITSLTTNPNFSKGKFKALAENYFARNQMKKYALDLIGTLGEPYTTNLTDEIDSGGYDSEWQSDKDHKEHPKLDKLIQSIRDEWEQKSSYRLVSEAVHGIAILGFHSEAICEYSL